MSTKNVTKPVDKVDLEKEDYEKNFYTVLGILKSIQERHPDKVAMFESKGDLGAPPAGTIGITLLPPLEGKQ